MCRPFLPNRYESSGGIWDRGGVRLAIVRFVTYLGDFGVRAGISSISAGFPSAKQEKATQTVLEQAQPVALALAALVAVSALPPRLKCLWRRVPTHSRLGNPLVKAEETRQHGGARGGHGGQVLNLHIRPTSAGRNVGERERG